MPICSVLSTAAFVPQWQSLGAPEFVRPANPKIFTPRPFAQKVFRPWPKISPALETFATTFPRIAAHWGSTSHTWLSYIQSILTICRFRTCEFTHLLKFICSPNVSAFHGPSPTFPERQQNKTKQKSLLLPIPSCGPPRRFLQVE